MSCHDYKIINILGPIFNFAINLNICFTEKNQWSYGYQSFSKKLQLYTLQRKIRANKPFKSLLGQDNY